TLLLFLVAGIASAAGQGGRIIAVGDLHGDLSNSRAVLRLAGLIDEGGHWVGGNATLIQTGDTTDRGADSKGVMDLFRRLELEARASGGRVICLLGNHEVMNVRGDWRYVSRGDIEIFGGINSRKDAFSRAGEYGRWLAGLDVAVQVGDAVFVHGGLRMRYAAQGLTGLNDRVHRSLFMEWDLKRDGISGVLEMDAPVWDRGFVNDAEEDACPRLKKVLRVLGVSRMVVGHSVRRDGRILSRCGGRLQVIDVGISTYQGGNLAAWEWLDGDARAIYPTGRVDLPDPRQ
ncbi:MAG: metallophosphatase, partial [Gammaproteobacteria bacterium]|nr:metallophosphatase [Gammaproteobacteria bacterium]